MLKYLIMLFSLTSLHIYADTGVLQLFDEKQYSPMKHGLKDLSFKAKVDGLEKNLKERFALSKLNSIYFQVYWQFPGRVAVEVMGMPSGFEVLKNELKTIILEKMDLVIPQEISSRLRGYEFKKAQDSNGKTILTGTDRTQTNMISQIHLTFAEQARLQEMKMISPAGTQNISYVSSEKSWSNNERVVEKIIKSSRSNEYKNENLTQVEYVVIDNLGLPQKIETTSSVESLEDKEAQRQEIRQVLQLWDYKVNKGLAAKYFIGQDDQ